MANPMMCSSDVKGLLLVWDMTLFVLVLHGGK